jgi:hypothetical protein
MFADIKDCCTFDPTKKTKTKKTMNTFNISSGQTLKFEAPNGNKFSRTITRFSATSVFSKPEGSEREIRESWNTINGYLSGKQGVKKLN